MSSVMEKLQIRYIKLHFTLEITEDGHLPRNKASALRGGMGHALLTMNCIRDRRCEKCDFAEDCLVQRMMYPKMKIRPEFMTTKDSEGFVIECVDTREWFEAGEEVMFNLLLFGRNIVYFHQYLQAFYYFGTQGIGKEHIRFQITRVTNTVGETLVDGNAVYSGRITVMHVSDYVRFRLGSADIRNIMESDRCRLVFQTPLTLKYQGTMQDHFHPDAVMAAINRRIYILNCYEGNAGYDIDGKIPIDEHYPTVTGEKAWRVKVKRYSGTQNSFVDFNGIRGWCDLRNLDETTLELMLAGELIHIGKNTSFGFGKYSIVENMI